MNITISPMAKAHIKGIAEIEKQCFSKPWSENGIMAELTNPTAIFFVAHQNEQPVGYIGVHAVQDEGYIANLAVLPEFRKNGIAGTLLDTVIGLAMGMQLAFLSLEVRISNTAAIALYKKYEFIVNGRRNGFYSQPKEDAYIMTLHLEQGK